MLVSEDFSLMFLSSKSDVLFFNVCCLFFFFLVNIREIKYLSSAELQIKHFQIFFALSIIPVVNYVFI